MWSPTHVQVLVKKARGLKIKGKDGTNDAFVTIGLGKEKYQTSVKEKAAENVEWCEQCELGIPTHGNTAEIVLTALHRNFLGVDEFLGVVTIPLRDFDVYDRPRTKWYPLKCKPGQSKNDYRGDLEVRTAFTVKAVTHDDAGSTADLSSKPKHKGSLQSLNKAAANFGGSLLNLGQKEKKHLKKVAESVTHKVEKVGEKAKKNLTIKSPAKDANGDKLDNSLNRFSDPFSKIKGAPQRGSFKGGRRNLDPGVNSDDEDDDMFRFDTLSQGSSGSSLNVTNRIDNLGTVSKTSTPLSGSLENLGGGEMLRRNTPGQGRRGFVPPQESPLVSSSGKSPKVPTTEDMDEWELKLLGKKGVPAYTEFKGQRDNLSQISGMSMNSGNSDNNSRANTLERSSRLSEKLPEQTPNGQKKKIIPVHSDFESSPSPEDSPSSPNLNDSKNRSNVNSPSKSVRSENVLDDFDERESSGKKKKILSKFGKTSISFRGEKDRHHKNSNESLSRQQLGHNRTYSDGSAGSNGSSTIPPPSGPRVVLGRENTPTGNQELPQKIPKEVWDRFDGKSREDLIQMIVGLQATVENQARKQSDLEDYIDSLLMKVLSTAPDLLQKKTFEVAGKNTSNGVGLIFSKKFGFW